MSTIHNQNPTFHLGLTMAGAVSAGCYSAGVIDYLFEILDLWEQTKLDNSTYHFDERLIPRHRVVIDVMGGASAGGMTTMMTSLYALSNEVKPVKTPFKSAYEKGNVLYDSWVHLNDSDQNKTFNELWGLDDLKEGKLFSLLNSKPIDDIADRAYGYYPKGDLNEQVGKLPGYISKNLEVLLSHTVLRGIPLEVDFSTFRNPVSQTIDELTANKDGLSPERIEQLKKLQADFDKKKPTHTSYEHALISHFKLNGGNKLPNQKNFWLNPNDQFEQDRMKNATIATGAFPVGLKYRKLSKQFYSDEYVKSILKRSIFSDFGVDDPDTDHKLLFSNFPENYESITVDGGAVNNEPYSEVTSIVRNRAKAETTTGINYGIVMIDPFPDFVDPEAHYSEETDLIDVIPSVLGSLRDQSKLKRKEMIDNLSHTYVKGQIYPRKHRFGPNGNIIETEKYPIASASFNAFGGFLDVNFRVHDFFLGRDNARNFFRYFFSLPYDKNNPHPIHKDWTEEMINVFGFIHHEDKLLYLPIIPDLNLLIYHSFTGPLSTDQAEHIERIKYNFSGVEKSVYTVPERPKYDPENLFAMKGDIQQRIKRILEISKKRIVDGDGATKAVDNSEKALEYELWLKENRFNTFWRRFGAAFVKRGINLVFGLTKGALARSLTEAAMKTIIKDLINRDLLSGTK